MPDHTGAMQVCLFVDSMVSNVVFYYLLNRD